MEEYNQIYTALADAINIDDITSSKDNQDILRRLKENDATLNSNSMRIISDINSSFGDINYLPTDGEDLEWLGIYLGGNSTLHELDIAFLKALPKQFYKGLDRNRSIRKLSFNYMDLLNGEVFQTLNQFFTNNHDLVEIDIHGSSLEGNGARLLSSALHGSGKQLNLKGVSISNCIISRGQSADIIKALSTHLHLERLQLANMSIGQMGCTALATLLQTNIELKTFRLVQNGINDEGIEAIAFALASCDKLEELNISNNPSITIKGWENLSSLLKVPDSDLEKLNNRDSKIIDIDDVDESVTPSESKEAVNDKSSRSGLTKMYLSHNNIGDKEALHFANALVGNSSLEHLSFIDNRITCCGWEPFVTLLIERDTCSVNETYHSNHTLRNLNMSRNNAPYPYNKHIEPLLRLNSPDYKGQVAMDKILIKHSHFDMRPFFEWEFKVLPIMIKWFATAKTGRIAFKEKMDKMRLSSIYDFIKEFPMLYVEPMTRHEIEEYTVLEERLLEYQTKQVELAEIRKRKSHAMMRL